MSLRSFEAAFVGLQRTWGDRGVHLMLSAGQEYDDTVELWIKVLDPDARGQRLGRRALAAVLELADLHGAPLEVHPEGREPPDLTTAQLGEWYERRGFVWGGDRIFMRREPAA